MEWFLADIECRNVRERIWDAIFTCAIRYFLFVVALALPRIAPRTQPIDDPYADLFY